MKGQEAIEARDRIMEAAKAKGVKNMSDLARRVGMHEHTFRNMGQGHMPPKEKLEKVAEYLGMTLDEIVGGAYTPPQRKPREIQPKIERESENMPKQHSDSLRKVLSIIPNLSDRQLESALDYLKYLVGNSERD
jgi:lambda repressor-like predicted transcriptional regulator